MIKYLKKEEKVLTKPLYKEAFFEDSDNFVEYYYSEKTKDNRILADIEGTSIRSMIMLNPYTISVFGKKYSLDYIVAVATKKEYKRQGYMRRLLDKVLIDMNSEKVPFTYLIPANKDYYLPFDFAFVARKNVYDVDLSSFKKSVLKGVKSESKEACEILRFINDEVSKGNDVYTYRDMHYFERELKEISSEDGFINIYREGDDIVAYESFWGLEKIELKERIVSSSIAEREYGKENIMVRITDVAELLSNFRSGKNIDITIKINDNIVEAQNACFRVQMGKDFANVCKISDAKDSAFVEFDIADFTAWIFGYNEDVNFNIVNFVDKSIAKDSLDSINKISGIFINELV